LKSVIDYDQNSKKYRWTKKITSSEMEKAFSDLGGVDSIQIIDKSNSGRVLKIRLYGTHGNKIISGKTLRERLQLLSTKFELVLKFNQMNLDDKPVYDFPPHSLPPIPTDYFLLVKGYGAGHGVGMSQWGAKAMAESGAGFRQILKHYYTGVHIKNY